MKHVWAWTVLASLPTCVLPLRSMAHGSQIGGRTQLLSALYLGALCLLRLPDTLTRIPLGATGVQEALHIPCARSPGPLSPGLPVVDEGVALGHPA